MARSSNLKEDRLSNLPESILDQIVSLLSTKEAIATSILAKNWRLLWTSVINLDISDAGSQLTNSEFRNFVNRIFLLIHQPAIHRFALKLNNFPDRFCINKWICSAVDRKVRKFELEVQVFYFAMEDAVHLPTSLFYLESLEVLKLNTGISLTIPKSSFICFPNLKFLSLNNVYWGDIIAEGSKTFPVLKTLHLVWIDSDEKLKDLIRNCPSLEHLFITRDEFSECLEIYSPTLTHLEFEDIMENMDSKIEIYAPNLQYFTVTGWLINQEVIVKETNSIIEARLNGVYYCDFFEVVDDLMKVVENVQRFILTGSSLDDMEVLIPVMPLFHNLTWLEVDLSCCGLKTLQCFLEKSMNLQHLVIKMVASSHKHRSESCPINNKRCLEQAIVPECLISSLKNVKILGEIDCNISEFVLIENILKNATKLEIMAIVTCNIDFDQKNQVMQKISLVPRGSAACEILFS